MIFSLVLDTKLTRRHTDKLFKSAGKIALIIVADLEANLRAVLISCQQKPFCTFYPHICKVIDYRNAHLFLEYMSQPRDA